MSVLKPLHPGARILDGRLTPVENNAVLEAATMSLSTPIVSAQDGPRMSGMSNIPAHRKAAPFRKGGKRRKAVLAKEAVRKAKAAKADYSNLDLAFKNTEPRGKDGRWIRAAQSAVSAKDRNSIRTQAISDYQNHYTSDAEYRQVLNLLDAADTQAQGHAEMDHRLGQSLDTLAAKRQAAKAARQGTVLRVGKNGLEEVPDPRRKTALGRLLHRKYGGAPDRETRQALGIPKGYNPRAGLSLSQEEGGETDLAFRRDEKRDRNGKWAKGGPTWLPEKGARSQAEFDYLSAKNTLAKARLSGDQRAIAKAQAKVNTSAAALATGRQIVDGYKR